MRLERRRNAKDIVHVLVFFFFLHFFVSRISPDSPLDQKGVGKRRKKKGGEVLRDP